MMRRFGFYILAALLTFSVGSVIAVKFYCHFYDNSAISSQSFRAPQYKSVDFSKPSSESNGKQNAPKTLFCEDQEILIIWKELINDKSFREWEPLESESLNCADMLEVKRIDLNQDDEKEFLIRGKNFNLCSATGNCAFWIFEKRGTAYRKILYSTDYKDFGEVSERARKGITKGYFDVVLRGHLSASDTTYRLFRFDGKKYQEKNCSVLTNVPGTNADPQWEFISCKEYYSRNKYY